MKRAEAEGGGGGERTVNGVSSQQRVNRRSRCDTGSSRRSRLFCGRADRFFVRGRREGGRREGGGAGGQCWKRWACNGSAAVPCDRASERSPLLLFTPNATLVSVFRSVFCTVL